MGVTIAHMPVRACSADLLRMALVAPQTTKGPGPNARAPREITCAPVSRVLYPETPDSHLGGGISIIYLGCPSRNTSIDLPAGLERAALPRCPLRNTWAGLFGLSARGVYRAVPLTRNAVVSYTTLSPLPRQVGAVCFLLHFPWPGRHQPDPFPLGSTVPYAARTFLPPFCKG